MMSPEKLADQVSDDFIKSQAFSDAVESLRARICDDLIYDVSSSLGVVAREKFGATFKDENFEAEYGMTVEGNIRCALTFALVKYLKEY